jgi:hypothetical protein
LREAIAAVKRNRKAMLRNVGDRTAWGPAKTFAMAAQDAGIDLGDPAAVSAFVERFNEGLAA